LPFFIASFLRRLPNELRVLLGHDDFSDLKAVSQKADALWQICQRAGSLAAVAALDPTEELDAAGTIAGVGQRSAKGRSAGQPGKKKQSFKKSVTYCWRHHQFGDKAFSCADLATCMWAAGN
jgi:hypothetical protein